MVTAQSWPLFLYHNFTCDVEDVENGLFKSALLIKVHSKSPQLHSTDTRAKAFMYIFTSPTSAAEIEIVDDDEQPPAKRPRKSITATRSSVATLIGLQTVTPRAIAYVSVQVRLHSHVLKFNSLIIKNLSCALRSQMPGPGVLSTLILTMTNFTAPSLTTSKTHRGQLPKPV